MTTTRRLRQARGRPLATGHMIGTTRATVIGLAVAVIASVTVAPASAHESELRAPTASGRWPHRQGGILGRYVLRSVGGINLPAPVQGEDARHKIQIMDGVLILNSDGTYICQTIAQTTYMGLVRLEADTLHGRYATIGGAAITFGVPPKEVDTVATTGGQIAWTHPTRQGIGIAKFVYTR
jgi:hypothetical protein